MVWVLDLDGVVWLGDQPLPGAADAVARLRAAGERVLFATNNSFARVEAQEAKLARVGIPAEGDVVTSAMAAAVLVEPGERALVCGGPGVVQALEGRGAEVVGRTAEGAGEADDGPVDVVVVGFHRDFEFEGLRRAVGAVRRGARLVATNDDATYPTPTGLIPGGGALAAAVAYAAGVEPVIAGKPHRPMADAVLALGGLADGRPAPPGPASGRPTGDLGPDPGGPGGRAAAETDGEVARGLMVGDRPSTDGAFATTLGFRFGLVLSGVTTAADLPVHPTPDVVAPDLATLVTQLLP